ncbi:MAG TPA: hypothetical protein VN875_09090 [Candidatus Binatus sp.]|nr:hypothetical protein [Candidatus Binatus sp.]
MVHIVAYDLRQPNDTEENYRTIIDAIKTNFNSWCHIEQSVWLIDAPTEAIAVRNLLKDYLHQSDVLFVARLTGNWGSWNFGDERNKWLAARVF